MILRRMADGIRTQNWFTVFIELLIVVFGVYIGIYIGEFQSQQEHTKKTNQALMALEDELRSDLSRVNEVIAIQSERFKNRADLIDAFGGDTINSELVGELLENIFKGNDTFYPNLSGYEAMKTAGFLSSLPDQSLRLHLSRLFERELFRQSENALLYDQMVDDISIHLIAPNFDRVDKKILTNNADSRLILRSAIFNIGDAGNFYLSFLKNQIKPDIERALEMIDAYQGETQKTLQIS